MLLQWKVSVSLSRDFYRNQEGERKIFIKQIELEIGESGLVRHTGLLGLSEHSYRQMVSRRNHLKQDAKISDWIVLTTEITSARDQTNHLNNRSISVSASLIERIQKTVECAEILSPDLTKELFSLVDE